MTALPPLLSPISIHPPPSSHCTSITARKDTAHGLKMVRFKFFTPLKSRVCNCVNLNCVSRGEWLYGSFTREIITDVDTCMWENKSKMRLEIIAWQNMDWIHLAQGTACGCLARSVLNFYCRLRMGEFMQSL